MKYKTKIVSIVLFLSSLFILPPEKKQKTEWKGTRETEKMGMIIKDAQEKSKD